MLLVLKALAVGLGLCLFALGPTNIVAMRHTFARGFWTGMMVALGSSLVDLIYIAVPAFSISFIDKYLHAWWINPLAGLSLLIIGLYCALSKNSSMLSPSQKATGARWGSFGMGFVFNIIHPTNVFAYVMCFSIAGIGTDHFNVADALTITGATLLGSVSGWVLKIWLINKYRHKLTERTIDRITRIAGWLMAGIGLSMFFFKF